MFLFIFNDNQEYDINYVNAIVAENEQKARDFYYLKKRHDARNIDEITPQKIELKNLKPGIVWSNEYGVIEAE